MKSAGAKAMALVDGQLAPADVPALVEELARNASLVAELQGYLTTSRSRLAGVYAAKTDEPVPRRLVDAVLAARMSAPAEVAGVAVAPRRAAAMPSLVGLFGRLAGWLRGSRRVPAWSLAAGPTLAAVAAFTLAAVVLPLNRGGFASTADLSDALDRTASGRDVALATVRPMLSFSSKGAGWCRQYEMRSAGRQTSHGLACRGQGGGWRVIASTPPATGGGYAPAGVDRRKVIDDIVTSMIDGDPLSPEGEATAIGKGWQL